jgi:hypothetical protein
MRMETVTMPTMPRAEALRQKLLYAGAQEGLARVAEHLLGCEVALPDHTIRIHDDDAIG